MSSPALFLEAFTRQCLKSPDAIALEQDDICWTYRELNKASDQIAENLRANAVAPHAIVAIVCQRSLPCLAAIIGVMKLGAAFMPVDLTAPDARITYFFQDAAVSHCIADDDQAPRLERLGLNHQVGTTTIGSLTTLLSGPTVRSTPERADSLPTPTASDTAYLMYTSGSTGKPKGVVISQGALALYCLADCETYELTHQDRTLQFSTLSFDISIEEIFPPLCVGSTVVLRPTERSDSQIELSDYINRYQITALHIATGYWHEWVNLMHSTGAAVPASLRLAVVTGEKVSVDHYYRWRAMEQRPVLWANAYGPTEATVSATVFIPSANWQGKTLPIGKPLPGYQTYILNAFGQPVDQNETGELYIGGSALADGYLNQPDLSASVFVPDPFSSDPRARLYKTGDLARWQEDGNIAYAGRTDHQLKIGSYRIEPGEIEDALHSHPDVEEAIVTTFELTNKKQLVAYLAVKSFRLTAVEISEYLAERLPPYMLPTRYARLDQLPKTVNGKVDRSALPSAIEGEIPRHSPLSAPINPTERALHSIWSRILGISALSIHDSFIGVGGNSLTAIETISAIQQELDFTVSTRDFFFLDTIALLAGHIDGKPIVQTLPGPVSNFVNNPQRQLYTVIQHPAKHNSNGRGILLAAPFSNEQRRAQRPFKTLMQNFARQGYTVKRFDWRGTANSSGSSRSVDSIEPWIEDLQDAANQLAKHVGSLDVVSVRLGTLIAASTAFGSLPITGHYYWDPVLSGAAWMQEMHTLHGRILNDSFRFLKRRKPTTTDIEEFAGFEVNQRLKQALLAIDFKSAVQNSTHISQQYILAPTNHPLTKVTLPTVQVHVVDEHNDWTNARTTTTDMNFHHSANQLADLLTDNAELSNRINVS